MIIVFMIKFKNGSMIKFAHNVIDKLFGTNTPEPPYQVVTKTLGEHATVYIIADTEESCKLGIYDYIRQFPYGNYLTVPTDMGYKADSGKFVASIYRTKEKYRER